MAYSAKPLDVRRSAVNALWLVGLWWAGLTTAALVSLVYDRTDLARMSLLFSVWLVPGIAGAKIIQIRDEWNGTPAEHRMAVPLLISGAVALLASFVT